MLLLIGRTNNIIISYNLAILASLQSCSTIIFTLKLVHCSKGISGTNIIWRMSLSTLLAFSLLLLANECISLMRAILADIIVSMFWSNWYRLGIMSSTRYFCGWNILFVKHMLLLLWSIIVIISIKCCCWATIT